MKCRVCGKKVTGYRQRHYCSKNCRQKYHNRKNRAYQTAWTLQRYDNEASKPSARKVQCLYCGRWYVQVGTHIVQRHKQTAREYREDNKLEVSRGITPLWYRKLKGDQALGNKTYKNILKAGRRYRFKKGQAGIG